MRVCAGTKRDGSKCSATVDPHQTYCWWHDPANAAQREEAARRGGRRAGRGRPLAELASLKEQLSDLYSAVLTDMVEPKVAAVLAQISNTQIRITEVELRVREQIELRERVEELEALLAEQKESYGA